MAAGILRWPVASGKPSYVLLATRFQVVGRGRGAEREGVGRYLFSHTVDRQNPRVEIKLQLSRPHTLQQPHRMNSHITRNIPTYSKSATVKHLQEPHKKTYL